MNSPLKRLSNIMAPSKGLRLIVLLILVSVIPLTVFISQKQQEIRQRAQTAPSSYYTIAVPDVWGDIKAYDQASVLSSIQGIVNITGPNLFFYNHNVNTNRKEDASNYFLLNELKKPGGFLYGKTEIKIDGGIDNQVYPYTISNTNLANFINTFRSQIQGAVVWGEDCYACKNVAATVAGADGRRLIILRKDSSMPTASWPTENLKAGSDFVYLKNGVEYLHQIVVRSNGRDAYWRDCPVSSAHAGTCNWSTYNFNSEQNLGLPTNFLVGSISDYIYTQSGTKYLQQFVLNNSDGWSGYYRISPMDSGGNITYGQWQAWNFGGEKTSNGRLWTREKLKGQSGFVHLKNGVEYLHQIVVRSNGRDAYWRDCPVSSAHAGTCNWSTYNFNSEQNLGLPTNFLVGSMSEYIYTQSGTKYLHQFVLSDTDGWNGYYRNSPMASNGNVTSWGRWQSSSSVYSLLTKPKSQGGLLDSPIPVLVDLTNKFTGRGIIPGTTLASTGSVKNDAYRWAIEKYLIPGKTNPNLASYRLDGYWLHDVRFNKPNIGYIFDNDYLISNKAFVFDLYPYNTEKPLDDPNQALGLDNQTMRLILGNVYQKSNKSTLVKIIGFPPFGDKYERPRDRKGGMVSLEWKTAEIASNYNSFLEVDIEGTMNTSFYKWVPKITYTQNSVPFTASKKWLYDQGYLSYSTGLQNKKFILWTSADFSPSWMLGFLLDNLWKDPNRGKIPIAWQFDPQMVERIPNIFNYLFKTKTSKDYFVGTGYVNPSLLLLSKKYAGSSVSDGVQAWVNLNKKYYTLLNYSTTANVINGNAGVLNQTEILNRFKEFSPNGVGILLEGAPPLALYNIVPIVSEKNAENYTLAQATDLLLNQCGQFCMIRSVLVSPTTIFNATTNAKLQQLQIEAVDPYTFFELLRIKLGQDTVPPDGNFGINNGATSTNSPSVTLTNINYMDFAPNASGVVKIRFSNDRRTWIEYNPTAGPIPWNLTSGNGVKTVYMQAKDRVGNWGASKTNENYYSDSITLNGPTPTPTRVPTATPTPTRRPTATPTPTRRPTATPTPTPTPVVLLGDANHDGKVDIVDFNIWRNEFLGLMQTKDSDFNKDGLITIVDFNIWRNAFLGL